MEDKNVYENLRKNYDELKSLVNNSDDDFVKVILKTTLQNYTDAMEWILEKECPIYPVRNYEQIMKSSNPSDKPRNHGLF